MPIKPRKRDRRSGVSFFSKSKKQKAKGKKQKAKSKKQKTKSKKQKAKSKKQKGTCTLCATRAKDTESSGMFGRRCL